MIPSSTYRIQFRNGMTFDRVADLIPYMKDLGISHLYASPVFTATTNSTHGYDVVDHSRISEECGGEEAFRRLSQAAHEQGIGGQDEGVSAPGVEQLGGHQVLDLGLDLPDEGGGPLQALIAHGVLG